MSRVLVRVCGVIAVIVLTLTTSAFAQGEQSGVIRGRLTSSDSLALPGVTVTVQSTALQGTRSTTSDVNGVYAIPGLPAGDYSVRLELQGFATVERKANVPLGSAAVVDQALGPARVNETVDVSAAATPATAA